MRSKILSILRNQKGYVSGQELCEKFGVSRTAVWKAINLLKEEGYEIEAVPNKGYHIVACPDVILAEEVKSRLQTKWVGKDVKYFEMINSTNTKAKQLAEEGASHGTLVIADEQNRGKGRRGRQWNTPPGTAIAMTLVVRPQMRPEKVSMLTLIMGLAVASACNQLPGVHSEIKWPNDIIADGKKICGILTEMSAELNAIHYLVIGVGINVNMLSFPEEIKDIATSLALITGRKVNRAEVIQLCMQYFEKYYEEFQKTEDMSVLMEPYNKLLVNCGQEVRVLEPGNEYTGISMGINEQGRLLVKKEDNTLEAVYSGEVSVRGIYGYL